MSQAGVACLGTLAGVACWGWEAVPVGLGAHLRDEAAVTRWQLHHDLQTDCGLLRPATASQSELLRAAEMQEALRAKNEQHVSRQRDRYRWDLRQENVCKSSAV